MGDNKNPWETMWELACELHDKAVYSDPRIGPELADNYTVFHDREFEEWFRRVELLCEENSSAN